MPIAPAFLTLTIAATLTVGVVADGGIEQGPRALFAAGSGLALLAALRTDPQGALRTARTPVVAGLATLAALSIVSALWTVAEPDAAVRWGLVLAGYAAVLAAGGVLAGRSLLTVAVLVAVPAALAGLFGLIAAGLGETPYAVRIGGSWRPGGFFEYPPALALAQVGALPVLVRGMLSHRSAVAAASAFAAAVAAAVVVLAQSRVMLALGLATILFLLLRPLPAPQRSQQLGCAIYIALIGLGAALIGGGLAQPGDRGAGELAQLLALPAVAVVGWTLFRRRLSDTDGAGPVGMASPGAAIRPVPALVALVVSVVVIALAVGQREGGGIERNSGFAHGREQQWEAALEVFGRQPVAGAGAESYYVASYADQGRFPVLYAHSLPLEVAAELGLLGVAALLLMLAGVGRAIARSRGSDVFWLLAPAAAALPLASLLDWSWHLAGIGAIWALAVGALEAHAPRRPSPEPILARSRA